jgi:8-oxo-dGTP pyrophosphatase MutT (NUDIX family)
MLQKSEESKLPYVYEFPGGKVDNNTLEHKSDAIRELLEETGISVEINELKKLDFEIDYEFEANNKKYLRHVIYYLVTLENKPKISINLTTTSQGELEDKHSAFRWMTSDEYRVLIKQKSVSPNSSIPLGLIQNQI